MSSTTIAAREWLALADTDPEHAYTWWDSNPDGYAIMPLGRLFDAVELSTVLAASVLGRPGTEGPALRDDLTGLVYVLVPPSTAETWPHNLGLCLGSLRYLRVPAVTRCTQPGLYWVTPPDGSGRLTDPAVLVTAITANRRVAK